MLPDFPDMAALAEPLRRLGGFFLTYGAILVTPGPNMLAVGGIAALHGFRGALPICFGIASGIGALGAALLLLGALGEAAGIREGWDRAGRVLGALLLLCVALALVRLAPEPEAGAGRRRGGTAFGAGFCTAVANPVTAAFFAAQLLGPLRIARDGAVAALALSGVVAMAFGYSLVVAALLARPSARRLAVAWQRPIRLLAALALALWAGAMLWPASLGWSGVTPPPAAPASGR